EVKNNRRREWKGIAGKKGDLLRLSVFQQGEVFREQAFYKPSIIRFHAHWNLNKVYFLTEFEKIIARAPSTGNTLTYGGIAGRRRRCLLPVRRRRLVSPRGG